MSPVNDAPTGANGTIGDHREQQPHVHRRRFRVHRPERQPGRRPARRSRSRRCPTAGIVTNDGSRRRLGDTIPVADIARGKLVFTPVTGANGARLRDLHLPGPGRRRDGRWRRSTSIRAPTPSRSTSTPINHAPSGAEQRRSRPGGRRSTFAGRATSGSPIRNDSRPTAAGRQDHDAGDRGHAQGRQGRGRRRPAFVPVADITANKLTFTPSANASGARTRPSPSRSRTTAEPCSVASTSIRARTRSPST